MPLIQRNKRDEEDLLELLSPARGIDIQLEATINELPERFVILILENVKAVGIVNMRILRHFSRNDIPGIYVSTNKPIASLSETFEKNGIDTKKIGFVDTITKITGEEAIDKPNFFYIDSPKNLIDLSVAMETGIEAIEGGKKFILIDSLSTLLVYNKPTVVAKFAHSVAGKMRAWNAKGVFLMIQGKDEEVSKTISQFCDKTISLG